MYIHMYVYNDNDNDNNNNNNNVYSVCPEKLFVVSRTCRRVLLRVCLDGTLFMFEQIVYLFLIR